MTNELNDKISILIKTFQRKHSLIRLLRSLEKLNCHLPILIADDSAQSYKNEILYKFPNLNIQYRVMPFDSGLSAGRNMLLRLIKTPYFILCDDDFRFDQSIDFENILSMMKDNNLDIAGGIFINHIIINSLRRFLGVIGRPSLAYQYLFKKTSVSRYWGYFSALGSSCTLTITNQEPSLTVQPCDLVNNFFIAKTKSILKMAGWDETFKVGEHEDFFYRAKLHGLKTALLKDFSIHHYPVATRDYLAYRERSFELKRHFPLKFGFERYQEINTDTNQIIYTYHPATKIQLG